MKLLLRRDQQTAGMLGDRIMFILTVRADLSNEERTTIKKCKLGDTVLYQRYTARVPGDTLTGKVANFLMDSLDVDITVKDLVDGKRFECKNIKEMMAAEKTIRKAADFFCLVLWRAMRFGGEEVIEFQDRETAWDSWMTS